MLKLLHILLAFGKSVGLQVVVELVSATRHPFAPAWTPPHLE